MPALDLNSVAKPQDEAELAKPVEATANVTKPAAPAPKL